MPSTPPAMRGISAPAGRSVVSGPNAVAGKEQGKAMEGEGGSISGLKIKRTQVRM